MRPQPPIHHSTEFETVPRMCSLAACCIASPQDHTARMGGLDENDWRLGDMGMWCVVVWLRPKLCSYLLGTPTCLPACLPTYLPFQVPPNFACVCLAWSLWSFCLSPDFSLLGTWHPAPSSLTFLAELILGDLPGTYLGNFQKHFDTGDFE